MLSAEDLTQIRLIVTETVNSTVPEIVNRSVSEIVNKSVSETVSTSVSEIVATAIAPLTDQIDYLARNMATREELEELRTELGDRKKDMDRFLTISDKTVEALERLRLEYSAVLAQLARQDGWFHLLADKIGVTLAY